MRTLLQVAFSSDDHGVDDDRQFRGVDNCEETRQEGALSRLPPALASRISAVRCTNWRRSLREGEMFDHELDQPVAGGGLI